MAKKSSGLKTRSESPRIRPVPPSRSPWGGRPRGHGREGQTPPANHQEGLNVQDRRPDPKQVAHRITLKGASMRRLHDSTKSDSTP